MNTGKLENPHVTFSANPNLMVLMNDLIRDPRSGPHGGVVEISCLEVIRELSNYVDKEVRPELRAQIAAHLPTCVHCTAVYDGLRNTITLVADGRTFELPAGFTQRLRVKLTQSS